MKHTNLVLCLAAALAAAGCAGQPAQPPVTRQVPVTAANAEAVQKAGYKLVNKDGEKLYCRTDPITGSRVQTTTQCLTEQQLFDQINETQNLMSLTRHDTPHGGK